MPQSALQTFAEFAAWASGPGLPAMAAGSLLVLLAAALLVRVAVWQHRAAGFDEADRIFLSSFRDSAHVLATFQDGVEFQGSPRWQIYLAGCRELAFHLIGSDRVEKNFAMRLRAAGRISCSQMSTVRRAMKRAAGEIRLDYQAVTEPRGQADLIIRRTGLLLSIAVFVETALNSTGAPAAFPRLILPALLPFAVSIVLSLMVSAASGSLIRRNATAATRIELFPAELSIMMERAFVDFGSHNAELPSVSGLGAPVSPGFSLPPSDGFTRAAP